MSLTKLNDVYVDTSKISYIGKLDIHIEHSVQCNRILHFFLIVIDGYPIEIKAGTREELEKLRNQLILRVPI